MPHSIQADSVNALARGVLDEDRPNGFVYDLIHRRPVETVVRDSRLTFPVRLGPCDGRMLMVCPQAIDRVDIAGPAATKRGESVALEVTIADAQGRPIEAVVPIDVQVRDAESRRAEWSGYHAAVGGRLSLTLDVAPNDRPGIWEVEATELASGRRQTHFFRVEAPSDASTPGTEIPAELANPVQPRG